MRVQFEGRVLGRQFARYHYSMGQCLMSNMVASAFRVLDKNTWATVVLGIGFGAYHEWLSANSIRKRIDQDFLKLLNKKFQVHYIHGFLVDLRFVDSL